MGFFESVEGFIFLVHDYWVGSQRDRFLLSRDFLAYTTAGPGEDGAGFVCSVDQFVEGEVRLEVEFPLYGRARRSTVVGLGRGVGFLLKSWGPRSVGGVTERLTYYLVSRR